MGTDQNSSGMDQNSSCVVLPLGSPLVPPQAPALPPDVMAAFPGRQGLYIQNLVRLALEEDGQDLTSLGVFDPADRCEAVLVNKEPTFVVGLPLISLIFSELGSSRPWSLWKAQVEEGTRVQELEQKVTRIAGPTALVLKAERVIINFISHLSGVANLTWRYVQALEGTGVKLLDTRKTQPGMRHLEKYAVRLAGAFNHRMDLCEMLMLKDNHVDAAGSITNAVSMLRKAYSPCPPLEVECRTQDEVKEAVACQPERILLDNMDAKALAEALPLVPSHIEAEVSGGVSLENIRTLALASPRRPDFISVGRITHSAPVADFSLRVSNCPR